MKNTKTAKTKKVEKTEKKNDTIVELRAQVAKAREELATMQMENIQHTLKNTTSLRVKKDAIARLLTAIRQLEMEAK